MNSNSPSLPILKELACWTLEQAASKGGPLGSLIIAYKGFDSSGLILEICRRYLTSSQLCDPIPWKGGTLNHRQKLGGLVLIFGQEVLTSPEYWDDVVKALKLRCSYFYRCTHKEDESVPVPFPISIINHQIKPKDRIELYATGGLYSIGGWILVTDLLSGRLDACVVDILIVPNLESCLKRKNLSFSIRLIARANPSIIIIGISTEPAAYSRGFSMIEKSCASLGLSRVAVIPRWGTKMINSVGTTGVPIGYPQGLSIIAREKVLFKMGSARLRIHTMLVEFINLMIDRVAKRKELGLDEYRVGNGFNVFDRSWTYRMKTKADENGLWSHQGIRDSIEMIDCLQNLLFLLPRTPSFIMLATMLGMKLSMGVTGSTFFSEQQGRYLLRHTKLWALASLGALHHGEGYQLEAEWIDELINQITTNGSAESYGKRIIILARDQKEVRFILDVLTKGPLKAMQMVARRYLEKVYDIDSEVSLKTHQHCLSREENSQMKESLFGLRLAGIGSSGPSTRPWNTNMKPFSQVATTPTGSPFPILSSIKWVPGVLDVQTSVSPWISDMDYKIDVVDWECLHIRGLSSDLCPVIHVTTLSEKVLQSRYPLLLELFQPELVISLDVSINIPRIHEMIVAQFLYRQPPWTNKRLREEDELTIRVPKLVIIVADDSASAYTLDDAVRKDKEAMMSLIEHQKRFQPTDLMLEDHMLKDRRQLISELMDAGVNLGSSRQAGGSEALMMSQVSDRVAHSIPQVLVDLREFRSDLPFELYKSDMRVVPLTLLVGDYVISRDVAFERKSIESNDLRESLECGRLAHQAKELTAKFPRGAGLLIGTDVHVFDLHLVH
eukprot:GHVH01015835.1.p1 GENE.GHVH01015835.1~~GHVH01015835.1.p1  ORF type:complete len:840 (-),score=117.79 GHVH01015835.1:2226-4745(-)